MITFVLHRLGTHTLHHYLSAWKPAGPPDVRIVTYDDLTEGHRIEPGAYIFDSFERFSPDELEAIGRFQDELREASPQLRVVNDARGALQRRPLLDALHDAGINDFRAFPIDEVPKDVSFPVFIRYERWHFGSLSPLISDRAELRRWTAKTKARAALQGRLPRQLMVVEFIETRSPDGFYRKYGALVVGDRIVNRHLFFDEHWMVKSGPIGRDTYHGRSEFKEEESAYLESSMFADDMRSVARLANVGYGRIDFGIKEGKPQIWEVNLNPTIFDQAKSDLRPRDIEVPVAGRLAEALADLEPPDAGGIPSIELKLEWPLASSYRRAVEGFGRTVRHSFGKRRQFVRRAEDLAVRISDLRARRSERPSRSGRR